MDCQNWISRSHYFCILVLKCCKFRHFENDVISFNLNIFQCGFLYMVVLNEYSQQIYRLISRPQNKRSDIGHCPTHLRNCPTQIHNCRTKCPTQKHYYTFFFIPSSHSTTHFLHLCLSFYETINLKGNITIWQFRTINFDGIIPSNKNHPEHCFFIYDFIITRSLFSFRLNIF